MAVKLHQIIEIYEQFITDIYVNIISIGFKSRQSCAGAILGFFITVVTYAKGAFGIGGFEMSVLPWRHVIHNRRRAFLKSFSPIMKAYGARFNQQASYLSKRPLHIST